MLTSYKYNDYYNIIININMKKFIEEIRKLAENLKKSEEKPPGSSPAVEQLYNYSKKAVKTLSAEGCRYINVYMLPPDLIPLFFHFESCGSGFVISNREKYVFFMLSAENRIFIYGSDKTATDGSRVNSGKMSQLFNISFSKENGNVQFYDSTGKELQTDDIVLLTLRWLLN